MGNQRYETQLYITKHHGEENSHAVSVSHRSTIKVGHWKVEQDHSARSHITTQHCKVHWC